MKTTVPRVVQFIGYVSLFWCWLQLPSAASDLPAPLELENLTWTELRDRIAGGTTTILIPIGGTEQNGPAMALGKHNVRVRFLAEKIAAQLGNALVAPVVAYVPEGRIDPPSGHMKFPGTITITDKAFQTLLEQAARSFKHHGFKTIVLLGDHGGYQASEAAVAKRLNREWKDKPARVFADLGFYRITQETYIEKLLNAGVNKSDIGVHAGLADTSLTLAIDPSMVRQERLRGGAKFGPVDGVYGGDPTRSSAALGQLGVDAIVEGTTTAIQAFVAKQKFR
ncbi:MAG: creatininase family protein [Mesorhizobium sp.]